MARCTTPLLGFASRNPTYTRCNLTTHYLLPITYYRAFHVCEAESAINLTQKAAEITKNGLTVGVTNIANAN
ncbi:hypothetical protein PJF56_18645 [Roseofilum sp. BLCC_M91]|uniref:Uncharacterized protein n=1 Tax=Roseofilum halophilum BLCC-M91 TaxID=3022259 RepID=A0ABT7BNX4_9CYAN|nr:hypothetical protein [Roseofilum halophilum]MDJ1180884.1 hypothetical protein [Roseofilum halophilum BLCC-M91]